MQKWVAIPFRLSKEEYTALSKEARAKRKLRTMHITWDILRSNGEDCKSAEEDHAFIEEARARLIVPFLKGAKWGGGKQAHLNWHLKAGPHRFYPALAMMAKEVAGSGAEHIAIFPLKRKGAPGHVHLDSFGLPPHPRAPRTHSEHRRERFAGHLADGLSPAHDDSRI